MSTPGYAAPLNDRCLKASPEELARMHASRIHAVTALLLSPDGCQDVIARLRNELAIVGNAVKVRFGPKLTAEVEPLAGKQWGQA